MLDRQTPLPQPAAPGPGSRIIAGACTALGISILGVMCFWNLHFLESFRQSILVQFERVSPNSGMNRGVVVVGVGILVGCILVTIHELGHLIVGICAGFRSSSMFLGPILFNGSRVSFNPDLRSWWHGGVMLYPDKQDKLRARAILMVLAGPAANLLTGCGVLLLPFPKGLFSVLFIVGSIAAGVAELLLPLKGPTFMFDGRRIWIFLRHPWLGERWLALLRLTADTRHGVLPESLPTDLLAKAIAVRDKSADTVVAHAFAYSAAFHQRRDADAGEMLEICLTYSGFVIPAVREALMSDTAVFQARRRRRPDLAEQWLAQIPRRSQNALFRLRAEAAILEARGDGDGALAKLAEVEAAIGSSPNRQREMRLLQRWKAKL